MQVISGEIEIIATALAPDFNGAKFFVMAREIRTLTVFYTENRKIAGDAVRVRDSNETLRFNRKLKREVAFAENLAPSPPEGRAVIK